MARTTPMNLVELMVMKDDIRSVLEFLGKKGTFQFQNKKGGDSDSKNENPERDLFVKLQDARSFLNINDIDSADLKPASCAGEKERELAEKFLADVEELKKRQTQAADELRRVKESKEEAESFKNLKVPFSELDHLSFLSLKIGKIIGPESSTTPAETIIDIKYSFNFTTLFIYKSNNFKIIIRLKFFSSCLIKIEYEHSRFL